MRASVNWGRLCATPHTAEASVKMAIAAMKMRRAPKRSAVQPLIGMNTASVTKYAEIPTPTSTAFSPRALKRRARSRGRTWMR